MASAPPSDNAERLEYLYFNLVGQLVRVHTIDGAIVEGIFVSRTDAESDEEPGIYLNCTRFLASKLHKPTDAAEFSPDSQLVQYKDIVLISAVAVKLRTEVPGSANAAGYRGEHDLKTMDWAEMEADETTLDEGLEDEPHRPGQWDQFAANEKFGVKSTYDENLYTTALDKSKVSKEDLAKADSIARAIDRSQTRGNQHRAERRDIADLEESEGELFSDVARKPARVSAKESTKNAGAGPGNAPRRGGADETMPAAAPVVGTDAIHKPNPAAMPFVPSRVVVADYIKTLASAVLSSANCFSTLPDWPGEAINNPYDRDTSSYSQAQMMPQQQPAMQPPHMNNQYGVQHHHHHHQHVHHQNAAMASGGPAMMPSGYPGGMPHQGYNVAGQMGGMYNVPPQQQQQHMPAYGEPNMQGPPPRPQPTSGPRSSGKSQPQQPVSSTVPHQQQQQQPPQQGTAAVPAVDNSAGDKQAAPGKRLKRGGGGGAQRSDGGGAADAAGTGPRRGGR